MLGGGDYVVLCYVGSYVGLEVVIDVLLCQWLFDSGCVLCDVFFYYYYLDDLEDVFEVILCVDICVLLCQFCGWLYYWDVVFVQVVVWWGGYYYFGQ